MGHRLLELSNGLSLLFDDLLLRRDHLAQLFNRFSRRASQKAEEHREMRVACNLRAKKAKMKNLNKRVGLTADRLDTGANWRVLVL